MNLSATDFTRFFEALWGFPPFPWQRRLAETVSARGWPAALDLPTATGKTATIDIAVFQLALDAEPGVVRRAPMRIVFVVDRRLVVDSAYERAAYLARRLASPESGVLQEVAERLRHLAGPGETPLQTVRLRGGTPREPDWVRSPAQPTVVVSTVDQVGSRILFRGYGVSGSMRPVHAGLLGSDALFLLDEAHLSQPFAQTLDSIRRYRQQPWAEEEVGPFAVVHLSATLPTSDPESFKLTEADRTHPTLQLRLEAHKPAKLRKIDRGSAEGKSHAGEFAKVARELLAIDDSIGVIAIVVNRVALARAIHEHLRRSFERHDNTVSADVALLIGRSRALDRERLLRELLPRLHAGRSSDDDARKLIVVATQCIEAGADLDFDALVSQIAPLDCLRQRFGRLDRLGRRHQKGQTSPAIILATPDEVAKRAFDPIYGQALAATWQWLLERGGKQKTIDFGLDHLELPDDRGLASLLAPRAQAPVMLPAYVDAFVQTSPAPGADPEVSLFLHGPDAAPADVEIVWRADLEEGDLADDERACAIVAACPPSSLETLAIPVAAARRWLTDTAPIEMADVEGAQASDALDNRHTAEHAHRRAFRWRGSDDPRTGVIAPNQLHPGDLIVVPAAYGGCDQYGWNPNARASVRDLGFQAMLRHRRRLVLRLHPLLLSQDLSETERGAAERTWRRVADGLEQWHDDKAALLHDLLAIESLPECWRRAVHLLLDRLVEVRLEFRNPEVPRRGAVLLLRRQLSPTDVRRLIDEADSELVASEPSTEGEVGSVTGARQGLRDHCERVAELACTFARRAGLPANRIRDIGLAAFLHDFGKAEERFQIYLRRGDEFAWEADRTLLAKSGTRPTLQELRHAAQLAGLPAGARHECWSVLLAQVLPRLQEASDPDLVLWLIGTHHGHGRPFFPPVSYPAPGEVLATEFSGVPLTCRVEIPPWRLDSGWMERFERLKRRYGPWEIARMEAILRLADHRASDEETVG